MTTYQHDRDLVDRLLAGDEEAFDFFVDESARHYPFQYEPDIKADLDDADTAYVCLDNHKFGDFAPYLLKTTDRGKSWRSMAGDLPDRHLVWRLVQDHVKTDLFFLATEFGIFFTVDGGEKWIKLAGGVPLELL